MHKRAQDLISELRLHTHPEGGYFREIFRSANKVQPLDERSAPLPTMQVELFCSKLRTKQRQTTRREVWSFSI